MNQLERLALAALMSESMLKSAVIRQEGSQWLLYTRDGKRVLGRHPSRDKALAQERAIEAHKHTQ